VKITEFVVEAYGCEGPLNDGAALCVALRAAADAVGATVLGEAVNAYAPHGVTAVIFLAESHILIATWPEHGYAVAEVFLCNESMDPNDAWGVLESFLRPRRATRHEVPLRVQPG
jgi:S-adenosylmethionine decarboxylase